ncbi:PH domain leucine-rich repeat-containing protein phosphatase 2-like [Paramacrobiotus metropolitanus]|uniref:PH domain leucine-rich repeat-containing protein phosphatase 2-like n=1 Tax=Paramacrobiotus metropolitanus TaxID=2943436 RepID=UPI00244655DA|nr:PH domain leucine-rich repeat-containing protein phosphatase 2-like [Paramacrobiotus metropolitanus]
MWSIRSRADPGESARRKYMWDKTQHGTGSWWSSGFRESLDGSVVSRSRSSRPVSAAEWHAEGALYDATLAQERDAVDNWLGNDVSRGVIRIYEARINCSQSTLVLCNVTTTAQQVCLKVGLPPNALHYQLNGDVIRRMDPFDCPLALQNDYLRCIGFDKIKRIQQEGAALELADFIRFYAGKPYLDATFSRQSLCTVLPVRKQKGLLHPWTRRLCEISGTRLLIYPGTEKTQPQDVYHLVRGKVEESRGQRHHEFCLKITGYTANAAATANPHTPATASAPQTAKSVYLAFENESDLMKWSRKCNKAITKQPDVADLSNNHLEFLPENLFVNENLTKLNLRHNALKERPIEEDIYTIGWIDDLPRFTQLRSLNLANNDLRNFPLAVCRIRTLVELNMASNKLEDLPSQIADLTSLKALHLQANHLKDLPLEMRQMKELKLLVLAFNQFTSVPAVIAEMKQMDSLILAGNFIAHLPDTLALNLKHIHKLDLRMNQLDFGPEVPLAWTAALQNVTHIDLRDNHIPIMDLRALANLQFLNCQRNQTTLMHLSGAVLCYLNVSNNSLQKVNISPIPANLLHLDLSHNALTLLPDWIGELRRMETLICNFNHLTSLPSRIFQNICSLKTLIIDHNRLTMLPDRFGSKCQLETLMMHQNKLTYLPDRFLSTCNRLRVLNVSNNRLFSLPAPSAFTDQNRIQELYLAANHLQDDALDIVTKYPRLKVLNLAYNDICSITDEFFHTLELIEELNLSGNKLTSLPAAVKQLTNLQTLKLHSNHLRAVPDFSGCTALRVLDIGGNELDKLVLDSIMGENLKHLDVSFNLHLRIDYSQFEKLSSDKNVTLVDMKDRSHNSSFERVPPLENELEPKWKIGFAQTSGNRNKLCITQLRLSVFDGNVNEALFGIFDGGFNNEMPLMLCENFPSILQQEKSSKKATNIHHLKCALLKAHLAAGSTGQKTGASVAVCHAVRHNDETWLYFSNAGHAEAVLSRNGEPVLLSRKFLAAEDAEECERIRAVDGIITEDSLVNGSCTATRMIGASYMFPYVIPEPHCISFKLAPYDRHVIIANKGLWDVITHKEAINEIRGLSNTISAAKRLIDLAQSYGARGNLSVIVVACDMPPLREPSPVVSVPTPSAEPAAAEENPTASDNESDSEGDYFPQEVRPSTIPKKFRYPRSASQILLMDEQVQVARSAHSLTEHIEEEQNYYFQHRRDSLAEELSSSSTSPDMPSGCEKTVLTNGDDFEVHVSSSRARISDLSGNTLSGHGDSALGSSVNPSVSDGNGSPVSHDDSCGIILEHLESPVSEASSHYNGKSQDDEAVHCSDPMDDEECQSWQFLMNEALDGSGTEADEVMEEATLTDETAPEESPDVPAIDKIDIPRPPTPPVPPDPALFLKAPVKIRVSPKGNPAEKDPDPKRNKPLIDELESVLKKRLSIMEETAEPVDGSVRKNAEAVEKVIRPVKSSYQMVFKLANQSGSVAQSIQALSAAKRNL